MTPVYCAAATSGVSQVGICAPFSTIVTSRIHSSLAETHSISAGLDYPGVGPEHAQFKDSGRAEYVAADDRTALEGFQLLARTEGILGALEPSHAIGYLKRLAPELPRGTTVLLGLSGRGDKDVHVIARALGEQL